MNSRSSTIVGALLLTVVATLASARAETVDKRTFWSVPRHGANGFNEKITRAWWDAAKTAGIEYVRLAPNKWHSAHRDFLLGNADRFDSLVSEDLAQLNAVLDDADLANVPVMLTMLSLPGARWRQQNGDKFDLRLWRDSTYWVQSARFWQKLATHLKDRSNIVGYNILNEPIPEQAGASPAALDRFYRTVIAAIREVDTTTPIILDGAHWAAPAGLAAMTPVADTNVLYDFHVYEPWEYTNRKANGGRHSYPGPVMLESGDTIQLDQNYLEGLVNPVVEWAKAHHVAPTRIIAAEFGCNRTIPGADAYLGGLIQIFDSHGWHWAFYSFREDTWDAMDYELGTRPPGAAYWDAKERGENPELPRDPGNPIWTVIKAALGER